MEEALKQFHGNKSIFVDLGIRTQFNLPKLHNVGQYRQLIVRFDTTDNYSTQATERLHIDYAKDAYEATKHKEEFAVICSILSFPGAISRRAMSWVSRARRI